MLAVLGDVLAGEGEDVVEEGAVDRTEPVGSLLVLAFREGRIGLQVMTDVASTTLDQVAGELATDPFTTGAVQVCREVGEVLVQQAQQRAEGVLVAAVRGRGDQQDVTRGIGGDAAQQVVPLLAPLADASRERAAVGFVHDHQLRAPVREVLGALPLLDEVGGYNGESMPVEDGLAHVEVALQTLDGARQHEFRLDVELLRQLSLPLLG